MGLLAKVEVDPPNPVEVEPKPLGVALPKPPLLLAVEPAVLKGDFSEEAKVANVDPEKALFEVAVVVVDSVLFSGDLGDLILLNGDAVETLANPDDGGICDFGASSVAGAVLTSTFAESRLMI